MQPNNDSTIKNALRNQKLDLQVYFQSRNCDDIFVLSAVQLEKNTR